MFTFQFFQNIEWFRIFYGIAILAGLILVLRAAIRAKAPIHAVMGIFLWVAVIGIFFSKVLEWPETAWNQLLVAGILPGDHGKTALGGLLGGILGLVVAKKLLGLKSDVWSWFLAWPVVLGLFRVGCLMVGCCIGDPTNLPWGLSFGMETPIAGYQLLDGHIHEGATCTLPAHPTPLYEIGFAMVALAMIFWFQRRGTSAKALFFNSVAAYAGFRFLEEFIRPENAVEAGLNFVQWGLLAAIPVLLLLGMIKQKQIIQTQYSPSTSRQLIVALVPFSLMWIFRSAWSPAEMFGIATVMLTYAVVYWRELSNSHAAWSPQWAVAPITMMLAFLLMSQAAIDQTVPRDSTQQSVEVGVGGNFGKYRETCGDVHQFWNAGGGAAYSYNSGGQHQVDAGVKAAFTQDNQLGGAPEESILIGGNAYVEYQNRWVGGQAGVHFGRLMTNGQSRSVLPSAMLRIGPSDIFFVEGRVFSNGYAPVPNNLLQIGIGSGFGLKNGTVFRLGMGYAGVYLSPSIVVKRDYLLEPFASYGDNDNFQFGMGLRMRIRMQNR